MSSTQKPQLAHVLTGTGQNAACGSVVQCLVEDCTGPRPHLDPSTATGKGGEEGGGQEGGHTGLEGGKCEK